MYYAILNGMCYAHYLAAHPLGYGVGVWGLWAAWRTSSSPWTSWSASRLRQ